MDMAWSLGRLLPDGIHWLSSVGYLELAAMGVLAWTAICYVNAGASKGLALVLSASVFLLLMKMLNDPSFP
jgi:hypothetical protein